MFPTSRVSVLVSLGLIVVSQLAEAAPRQRKVNPTKPNPDGAALRTRHDNQARGPRAKAALDRTPHGVNALTVKTAAEVAAMLRNTPPSSVHSKPWAMTATDAAKLVASPTGVRWLQRRVWTKPVPPARQAELATALVAIDEVIALVQTQPANTDISDTFQPWGAAGAVLDRLAARVTDQSLVFKSETLVFTPIIGGHRPKHEVLASLRDHRKGIAYAQTGEHYSAPPSIAILGATQASVDLIQTLYESSDHTVELHAGARHNPAAFALFTEAKPDTSRLRGPSYLVEHTPGRIVGIERHEHPGNGSAWRITFERDGKITTRSFDGIIVN